MDPGIEEMMRLARLERMRARLPPPEHVSRAWKLLFDHKLKRGSILEDTQATLALQSLQYCSRCRVEMEARGESTMEPLIDEAALKTAVKVLSRQLQIDAAAHRDLAKAVYDEMVALSVGAGTVAEAMATYVRNLAYSPLPDHPIRAREFLLEWESQNNADITAPLAVAWTSVLHGMAKQNNEADVLATLAMLESRNLSKTMQVRQIMLSWHLRGSNARAIKASYADLRKSLPDVLSAPLTQTMADQLRHVLQWCLEHNELEYGHHIVRDAMTNNPPKPIWDTVFVWAAGTGKGADEIDRMLGVMEASNKNVTEREEPRIPDIATINGLVEFAISKNDPYLAERFISIGKAREISPDARTYILQMQYRLKVNDIDGALTAYANSQAMDLSSNEDIPTVNSLIVALCSSPRHDFESIMNIAADLSDRNARFEASTVAALTLLHLSRDEIHDTIDLLNTHAFHFSSAERSSIRDAIMDFAVDSQTPTSRTWDAYTIIRQIFDEIPRGPRTELMLSFFSRERPDMAVHVFNHMRQHSRIDTLPTVETYIAAFQGSARVNDLESLEVIHNQLKLDVNINPTTKLHNALIAAYTDCGQPRRALRFWDDIAASKEGPDYESIHITFRACEKAPFGDLQARELWGKLRRKGVETDQAMWVSYVGGIAGNGDLGYAFKEIERAESEGEIEVDESILGRLFNAVPGKGKQKFVEQWASEKWPQIWKKLEKRENVERNDGGRLLKPGEKAALPVA